VRQIINKNPIDMYAHCNLYHKPIEYGEPHHTINLHKEAVRKVLAAESADKARMLGELFIPIEVN
jgi:hypothetical protein